ncbi:calcium-activated chloride channel regulator 1-like [Discoglossus pictus]
MVKTNSGGYEDIVIAINPKVKEDVKIIENIQNMVKDASKHLFIATKNRLFIKSAHILIPSTWSPSSNYKKPKTETYDKADVIIANSFLSFDEKPYTLQYGQCGEPGRYIHFSPNYMIKDYYINQYGPRGKVFVHEWAHYRWGVFDEYNKDVGFQRTLEYLRIRGEFIKARCSTKIVGDNKMFIQGAARPCDTDINTGLYKDGCKFIPANNQATQESMMFAPALSSVTQFCDASTHNVEAPNQQNRVCSFRSTWDVIKDSNDIKSTPPRTDNNIPEPTFSLLRYIDRVVTLVLDVSGSMSAYDRIGRLYQAAELFLIQIVENNSHVGIVQFSSSASITSNLRKITSSDQRLNLKNLLPKSAGGGTNICSGIRSGIQVNKQIDGSASGTEIVILTDGEDNFDVTLCYPDIRASGAIIHVIALGPNAAKELEQIADMTKGLRFSATDSLDSNGLIDAFTGISAGNGDISQQTIQLESVSNKTHKGNCSNGDVTIDQTVGKKTFFLVTWQTTMPTITLTDPKGITYRTGNFIRDSVSKSARLEIPGIAETGPWTYGICNKDEYPQALGITVNSKAADENVPPIIVNAHMDNDQNEPRMPMVVYAVISQGTLPVKGANVTATIEPQTGTPTTLPLLDNGAGADIIKNDGVYSAYFTNFATTGRYNLKVRAHGKDGKISLTPPMNGAPHIPGYIKNGEIVMNPSLPEIKEDDLNMVPFSRTCSGGSFMVKYVTSSSQSDIFKPARISDLEAKIEDTSIGLTWTATGDDLDQGTASRYDLRMSTSIKELIDSFGNSTLVDTSSLIPQPAGSSETFTFLPQHVTIANGTVLYFGLVAFDEASQRSDLSNIARVAIYIPPIPVEPTKHHKCNFI